MNSLNLAWRNILRNRRRSLLTLAAIGVGSVAIILFGGQVVSTIRGLYTETIRSAGHLQIQQKGHLEFGRANPGRFAIYNYEALVDQFRNDEYLAPRLAVVTPILHVQGVAGNFDAGMSSAFSGQGVVPADQKTMLAWDGLRLGQAPTASPLLPDDPNGGVIGRGLAQLLGLCPALALTDCAQMPPEMVADAAPLPTDVAALAEKPASPTAPEKHNGRVGIELLAASPSGAPNVVRMDVLAAERQGVRELDNVLIGLPLPLAQKMVFGAATPAVSSIVVQLKHAGDLEPARTRIQEIVARNGAPLEVLDFHVINPTFDQIIGMFGAIFRFIALLMSIVALFSVANAVNMAVSERVGEIGTLRALGFERRHIRAIFVTEGALLGLVGSIAGSLAAVALATWINRVGVTWTPPGRTAPVALGVDVFGDSRLLLLTVAITIGLACVSAWLPSRRAARMEIVEALRHA
jgi:putative ABC transport system permease protein